MVSLVEKRPALKRIYEEALYKVKELDPENNFILICGRIIAWLAVGGIY